MNQVWLFFKLLEMIAGCACIYVHRVGTLNEEPMSHNMFFCGTFVGFVVFEAITCVRLVMGMRTLLRPMLFIGVLAFCMHVLCALVSMRYAEVDFHLLFMTDVGENSHMYFRNCRMQSIVSMVAAGIHLIESVLVLDIIVKIPKTDQFRMEVVTEPPTLDDAWEKLNSDERDTWARISADVFLLGKDFDYWLRVKSKWFCKLAGNQQIIVLPDVRSHSETSETALSVVSMTDI
ncbi:hypothetical protein AWZ03_006085 [Drosophila navojoa]|uniref:DUF7775 domain-containing protein n=1 Tax=Drosophila navojoa TaxID=7232 RepID=A0A484BFE9_DRONA|nr:uncharacterized protein LOC108651362 [Drosophila navojoa]TDG47493.1 hypothetical protein AWZ03_006085 [Drosophila navojoa]